MAVSPREILHEISPANIPLTEPPAVANYRPADMQGVSCAFCSKFAFTGLRGEGGDRDPGGHLRAVGSQRGWRLRLRPLRLWGT